MSDKKRRIVTVDEEKLKRMMAGDENEESAETEIKSQAPVTHKSNTTENSSQTIESVIVPSGKKKKHKYDYSEEFLRINKPGLRRPTTIQISEDNYKKIGNLLMFVPELSIAMFINNVLESHFREYGDETKEVIEKGIRKVKGDE